MPPNVWKDHLDEIEQERAERDKAITGLWNSLMQKINHLQGVGDDLKQTVDAYKRADEKAREGRGHDG